MKRLSDTVAIAAAVVAVALPAWSEGPMTPLQSTAASPQAEAQIEPPAGPSPGPSKDAAGAPAATGRGTVERRSDHWVRSGRWEFTSRLRVSAKARQHLQPELTRQPAEIGGMQSTYVTCIESDNAVPAPLGPQCTLDRRQIHGSRITWSMSCRNTHVRADGVARYHGDAMEATLVSHLRGRDGTVKDLVQHITGRYLGACTQMAAPPNVIPPAADVDQHAPPAAPQNESASTPAGSPPAPPPAGATPDAGTAATTDQNAAAADQNAAAADQNAPAADQNNIAQARRHSHVHHRRHRHYAHRRHRRHYARWGWRPAWSGTAISRLDANPNVASGP